MTDTDCAVCCALTEAIDALTKIVKYIDWSCPDKSKKEDFGLTKSFVLQQIGVHQKMQKWHTYYHSTGESLMETNREVVSDIPKPQRWRK